MFYSKISKKSKGFTLIELSVVIAIITILASISIPNVTRYLQKSRDAKRISDIQVLSLAIESFYDDNGHYPGFDDSPTPGTVEIGSNGDCIGVVGRRHATTGPCRPGIDSTNRTDGAVDIVLRTYIQGPVPRDPSYDNQPDDFWYGYDPHHSYFMPTWIDWSVDPAVCHDLLYPNAMGAGVVNPANNNTAVINVRRFETHTVEQHRDTCGGGTLEIDVSDYNVAFSEIGHGSGLPNTQ